MGKKNCWALCALLFLTAGGFLSYAATVEPGLGTPTVTPSPGSVGSAEIADDSIVNADVNSAAAIAQSKIANLVSDLAAKLDLAGGTMTGNIVFANGLKIQFGSGGSAPAHTEGNVFYDPSSDALAYHNAESEVEVRAGRQTYFMARNNTGSTITKGQVVYANGSTGVNPTIALAQSDSLATTNAVGVAAHDIENNTAGYVLIAGRLEGFNTSAFNDGDILYVSASVAGGLTATPPSAPNHRHGIGVVIRANASLGQIIVKPQDFAPLGFGTSGQLLGINGGGTTQQYWDIEGVDGAVVTVHSSSITISAAGAGSGGDFADGGEAGGAKRTLGNTDAFDLGLLANGNEELTVFSAGGVSVGATLAGAERFSVNGDVNLGQGVTKISGGSASAPSLVYVLDPGLDTGVYFPDQDTLGITTGGTERWRVDSAGRVGIATPTLPTDARFSVRAASDTLTGSNFRQIALLNTPAGGGAGTSGHINFADAGSPFLGIGVNGQFNSDTGLLERENGTKAAVRERLFGNSNTVAAWDVAFTTDPVNTNSTNVPWFRAGPFAKGAALRGDSDKVALSFLPLDGAASTPRLKFYDADALPLFTPSEFNIAYSPGDSLMRIGPGDSLELLEGLYVDDGGAVGVGNSAPTGLFEIGAASMTVTQNGNVLANVGVGIGFDSESDFTDQALLFAANGGIGVVRADSGSNQRQFDFRKARGSVASPTVVLDNDRLGAVRFLGHDGTLGYVMGARIQARVDGSPSTLNVPAELEFQTNDGSSGIATKMLLGADGKLGIGTTSPGSLLQIGDLTDGTTVYVQIDSENGTPPAADCDADSERGRQIHDHLNNRLYICGGASRGWDFVALTD